MSDKTEFTPGGTHESVNPHALGGRSTDSGGSNNHATTTTMDEGDAYFIKSIERMFPSDDEDVHFVLRPEDEGLIDQRERRRMLKPIEEELTTTGLAGCRTESSTPSTSKSTPKPNTSDKEALVSASTPRLAVSRSNLGKGNTARTTLEDCGEII